MAITTETVEKSIFRTGQPYNIDNVCWLFNKLVQQSFPFWPVEVTASYLDQWNNDDLKKIASDKNRVFLCSYSSEENPVGIILGAAPEAGVATIIWLLVDEPYRGKKIGTTLFKDACNFYKNLGCHKLKLTAPTSEAKDYYISLGMQEEGFHPKHWHGMDFWSLGMNLD